jgi:CRP-like cAMP-binding protein
VGSNAAVTNRAQNGGMMQARDHQDATTGGATRSENRILRALSDDEWARTWPLLETVRLPRGTPLSDADEPISHVYFPERGVASILAVGSEGERVDTTIVGRDGMVGLPVLLGTSQVPTCAMVQIDMEGRRMRAEDLRAELDRRGPLERVLMRYTQMVIVELAQLVLCNRLHSLEQRAARWLLQMDERIDGGTSFGVTQEFLAEMIGAQRPPVTEAVNALRDRGLIEYARGSARVSDPAGLEAVACECYRVIRRELDRLLSTNALGPMRGEGGTSTVDQ